MSTCKVPSCSKPVLCRELCGTHYHSAWRRGEFSNDAQFGVCELPGCDVKFRLLRHGKRRRRYCCSQHENKARWASRPPTFEPRVCGNQRCGKVFRPSRDAQVTCSKSCRKREEYLREPEGYKRRARERTERLGLDGMRDYNLQRNYGISLSEFNRMREEQGNKCAICRADKPGGPGAWHVDHDHETRAVRGLLCQGCNIGIGCLGDNPDRIRAAAEYVEHRRKLQVAV